MYTRRRVRLRLVPACDVITPGPGLERRTLYICVVVARYIVFYPYVAILNDYHCAVVLLSVAAACRLPV